MTNKRIIGHKGALSCRALTQIQRNEANTFDQKLGMRLRTLRQMKRISQEHLGDLLGVTFQQIQKYESGANRICPEKLDKCATIFEVPIGYIFGCEGQHSNMANFDKRVMTIAAAIASIPSDEVAKRIYHLVLAVKEGTGMKDVGYLDRASI